MDALRRHLAAQDASIALLRPTPGLLRDAAAEIDHLRGVATEVEQLRGVAAHHGAELAAARAAANDAEAGRAAAVAEREALAMRLQSEAAAGVARPAPHRRLDEGLALARRSLQQAATMLRAEQDQRLAAEQRAAAHRDEAAQLRQQLVTLRLMLLALPAAK